MRQSPIEILEAKIREMAGASVYGRGVAYYQGGRVTEIEEITQGVEAIVVGTAPYRVKLTVKGGEIRHHCGCPHNREGAFCKHCVATALAWAHSSKEPTKSAKAGTAKPLTLGAAKKLLLEEDHAALVQTLLTWAEEDPQLRERVILYASARAGTEPRIAATRRAFQKAVQVYGYVEYREAYSWADGVRGAIRSIDGLLKDGHAAACIELCEAGLLDMEKAMGAVDDSDGHLTDLREQLEEIHFRACQQEQPDQIGLAQRLFRFGMESELDTFYGAAESYAKVLGTAGLAEFRRLAEAAWQKVPARTTPARTIGEDRHFRITSIMESLAKTSGDIEALVAVKSRDLSYAYSYLQIAEVYRSARKPDKALEWAEKGLAAFPERTDGRLREFAADEYHRRKRHDDAMRLMWAEFSEHLSLENFKKLQHHAAKAGDWPTWRSRALGEVRERIAREKTSRKRQGAWFSEGRDHSLLVQICLHEGDTAGAWREAREGGCSDGHWLALAKASEEAQPEDAAPVYLRLAEQAVQRVNNSRYEEPVALLARAAKLMKRMDRGPEFTQHLESLRTKFKARRNFIKLLDRDRSSFGTPQAGGGGAYSKRT